MRGITVEDDYGSDIYNAQYWNEVTVDFDDHEIEFGFTVDGAGIVKATMDSYNGMYIMEYSGTFTGEYEGEDYRLEMDFLIEWGSYYSFSSEGTFSVNGEEYTFSVDASDLPGYGAIDT